MHALIRVPSPEDGDRAMDIFDRLLETAGSGIHHLVIVLQAVGGPALGNFHFAQDETCMHVNEDQALNFCHLLAAAVSGAHGGGFVMRTRTESGSESVCGWRFVNGDPKPLNRAEVFDAYCHNPHTGETVGPESGVEYKDAPVIHI
ncbi:hypothetical protein [Streptomyces sp. NPDC060022]|uniref:hypothetical protein n=1 Tax=Streptomyces sp. NPDC060022 TaxID=3347039 RepID=UPI0036CFF974